MLMCHVVQLEVMAPGRGVNQGVAGGGRQVMEEVAGRVNEHARLKSQPEKSVDEVAMGFIQVANETMCRPIRALTQMRVRNAAPHGVPITKNPIRDFYR